MINRKKVLAACLAAVITLSGAAACSKSDSTASSSTTVNWWTWDDKQAASYQKCADKFTQENPNIHIKISQYAVGDYFTKLTAGFVAGDAPDAFQNSIAQLADYASQGQLMPLDDLIKSSKFDMTKFSAGVDSWKYTDGKQYGLPLDWSAVALYYNADQLSKAGLTTKDIDTMTWNPQDGGTFDKVVARLTVDNKGVRGNEPGFDKNHVATYGVSLGTINSGGQTSWSSFVTTTGWTHGDKPNWPSVVNYGDTRFVKAMDYFRSLSDRGFAPKFGEMTVSNDQQLGSGKVAMITGGSWEAPTYAKLPNTKVGTAPTVLGSDGKTRSAMSNSNGNNIWAKTKHPNETWSWVSYMGSEECQTLAGQDGTFFPAIAASMTKTASAMKAQGVDLSTFLDASKNGTLYSKPATKNGAKLSSTEDPLIEAFFTHKRDDDVFAEMQQKSQEILAQGQ
jgi:multiple sugar transport system substrate-binding protein